MHTCIYIWIRIYIYIYIYICMYIQGAQEECARLREGVSYFKVYRYNPKYLCPKLKVTEIMAREQCGLLVRPRTAPVSWQSFPFLSLSVVSYYCKWALTSHSTAHVLPSGWMQCNLRLRCEWLVGKLLTCLLCFPTWNNVTCILCMDFTMAMLVLLLKNTKGVFPNEGFRLEVYLREFTRHCVISVPFRVFLFSLKGRWFEL